MKNIKREDRDTLQPYEHKKMNGAEGFPPPIKTSAVEPFKIF